MAKLERKGESRNLHLITLTSAETFALFFSSTKPYTRTESSSSFRRGLHLRQASIQHSLSYDDVFRLLLLLLVSSFRRGFHLRQASIDHFSTYNDVFLAGSVEELERDVDGGEEAVLDGHESHQSVQILLQNELV